MGGSRGWSIFDASTRCRDLGRRQHRGATGDLRRSLSGEPLGEQGHRAGEHHRGSHRRPRLRLRRGRARKLRGGLRLGEPPGPEIPAGLAGHQRSGGASRHPEAQTPRRLQRDRPARGQRAGDHLDLRPRSGGTGVPGPAVGVHRRRTDRLGRLVRTHRRPPARRSTVVGQRQLLQPDEAVRDRDRDRDRRPARSGARATRPDRSHHRRPHRDREREPASASTARVSRLVAPADSGWRPRARRGRRTRFCC